MSESRPTGTGRRWLMAGLAVLLIASGVIGTKLWWPTIETVEKTVTIAAPSSPSTGEAATEQVRKYLSSDNRRLRLEAIFQPVAKKVAKELENGKFGDVDKLDAYKTPIQEQYSGEGSISASTGDTYRVQVYWDAGMRIDYRPVFSSVYVTGPLGTVHLTQETEGWIRVDLTRYNPATGQKVTIVGLPEGKSGGEFTYPTTVDGFRQLDTNVLAALEAARVHHQLGPWGE